ncbi:MAG TPA: hypothetical protein VJK51_00345 [Candidatus Nanoarchaeia archaeon]|nr:hypothetical protein [Candidatus Nanoarchaeia archaeon]
MERRGIILILLGAIVLSLIALTLLLTKIQKNPLQENAEDTLLLAPPTLNPNCSDKGIQATWEILFEEPYGNIGGVIKNVSDPFQSPCAAYKNSNGRINLLEIQLTNTTTSNTTQVKAYIFNATDPWIQTLETLPPINIYFNHMNALPNSLKKRNITTVEATAEFAFFYKMNPETLSSLLPQTLLDPFASLGHQYYGTNILRSTPTGALIEEGIIFVNYTMDLYIYKKTSVNAICIPSWTALNEPCTPGELRNVSYIDTNACGITAGQPALHVAACDYDSNGLIGSPSNIETQYIILELFIGGQPINLSATYTGVKKIELKENGITVIEWMHDFTLPLNLKGIVIKKQDSARAASSLVIKGINASKTVYLKKNLNESNAVCIKNTLQVEITELTSNCNGQDEIKLLCPGNDAGISCSSNNNIYTLTGLKNTALKEWTTTTSTTSCTGNWTCTPWSVCSNGVELRSCTDSNRCNTIIGRPPIRQTCQPITQNNITCTPNYTCTPWDPQKCPSNGRQSRTCNDLNSCPGSSVKPETQICSAAGNNPAKSKTTSKNTWIILLIVLLVFFALVVGALLFYLLKKNPEEQPAQQFMADQSQVTFTK